MHPSCRERSGGGRHSWPFPPPAQLEAEHPAVMEISSEGQWGKLTDCLRSALLIYARMNPSRVLWFSRGGPLDVTEVVSSVSHHIDFPGFPVAQMVEHGASNAKIMGSIPRESKSW